MKRSRVARQPKDEEVVVALAYRAGNETVSEAIPHMLSIARMAGVNIASYFNGVRVVATPDSAVQKLLSKWRRERNRRVKEYFASREARRRP